MATLGLLGVLAGPAVADPPAIVERYEDVVALAYVDAEARLVALGGPPPEEGCFGMGFDDMGDVQDVTLPNGVVVRTVSDGDQPMQVYEGTSIDEVCEVYASGGSLVPVATGTVRSRITDNDAMGSGTRANVFGDQSIGRLTTPDGETCQFTARFRARVSRDGEFTVIRDDLRLNC